MDEKVTLKQVGMILVIGIVLGMGLKVYQEIKKERSMKDTSAPITEAKIVSPKKEKKALSLEEFIEKIEFLGGEKLTEKEKNKVYYQFPESGISSIYTAYPKDYYGTNAKNKNQLEVFIFQLSKAVKVDSALVLEESVPKFKKFNQMHQWDGDGENTFLEIRKNLEKKYKSGDIEGEDLTALGLSYNLSGDYEAAQKMEGEVCKKFPENCSSEIEVHFQGVVVDQDRNLLKNAEVKILNEPGISGKTDDFGKFDFVFQTRSFKKIRIKVRKNGYAEAFGGFYLTEEAAKKVIRKHDFVLHKSLGSVGVNFGTESVIAENSLLKNASVNDGVAKIQAADSTYEIQKGSLFDSEGAVYEGDFEVKIYQFDRESHIPNLLNLDVRSGDGDKLFLGGYLSTFGMPYVQFETPEGNPLMIKRSEPVLVRTKSKYLAELFEDSQDRLGMDRESLDRLAAYSASHKGYPITREYLMENGFERFPPWWILDQKRGMWDNVPFRLVDDMGTIETIFYTVNDL